MGTGGEGAGGGVPDAMIGTCIFVLVAVYLFLPREQLLLEVLQHDGTLLLFKERHQVIGAPQVKQGLLLQL